MTSTPTPEARRAQRDAALSYAVAAQWAGCLAAREGRPTPPAVVAQQKAAETYWRRLGI